MLGYGAWMASDFKTCVARMKQGDPWSSLCADGTSRNEWQCSAFRARIVGGIGEFRAFAQKSFAREHEAIRSTGSLVVESNSWRLQS